jgi:hypothetical protein
MMMTTQLPITTHPTEGETYSENFLYEQDYYLWLETTLKQLQERKLDELDWKHLIEEIDALGNEQRRRTESYLKQLLIHLLLYQYWEQERSYCANGWENEIDNFRDELEFLLRSKTLNHYFLQKIQVVYTKARQQVIKKTGLSPESFPTQCPFTSDQILDPDYLPD